MDSQIAPRFEQEPHNVGSHSVEEGDQGDHQEKKSVLKMVKAKAKKIKDTLKLHGHGHDHDHDRDEQQYEGRVPDDRDPDEEDDEDEEMVDNPEIHGSSGYEAAAIRSSVPDQVERSNGGVAQINYANSQPMQVDFSGNSQAISPPARGEGEVQLKVNVGRSGGIEEGPQAPVKTPASISAVREQETNRGQPEINLGAPVDKFGEDAHAPKERPGDFTPSNYQSKFTDPTGADSQEVGISAVLRSFDKMDIGQEPKPRANESSRYQNLSSIVPTGSHGQFSPELSPPRPIITEANPEPIQENLDASKSPQDNNISGKTLRDSSQGSSYTAKISSASSVIVDKAMAAKNVVASKLGYGGSGGRKDNSEGREMQGGGGGGRYASFKPVECGKRISATVTEKLSPVYEKVAGAGSNVMSKVQGTGNGNGNGNGSEVDSQVRRQDKGVSVKDYVMEKLKPGEEDKALSEVITEALYKRKGEAEAEKSNNSKAVGKVTESDEVKFSSSTTTQERYEEREEDPNFRGKGVVDKLKGVVGYWLGKGEEQPRPSQQSLGSTTGTEGFSTATSGELTEERRLQDSGN